MQEKVKAKVSNTVSNGWDIRSKYALLYMVYNSIQTTIRNLYNNFSSENTWEKVANLSGAKKMIDEFDKKEDEKEARLAEKDYDVEKIVGETFHKGETWFMVKWKGYKSE